MKRVRTTVAVVVGLVMLAVVTDPLAMSGMARAAEVGSGADGPCGLLTTDEVSAVLETPVTVVGEAPASCVYSGEAGGDPLSGVVVNISAGDPLSPLTLKEQAQLAFPDATEVQIAGTTALQTAAAPGEAGQATADLHVFPDSVTWLLLEGSAVDGIDIESALADLGTLLIPRWTGEAPLPGSATPAEPAEPADPAEPPLEVAGPADAPLDLATLGTLCELWEAAEVEAALNARAMRIDRRVSDPLTCSMTPRGGGRINENLTASFSVNEEPTLTFGDQTVDSLYDLLVLAFPDSVVTEVGSLDALLQPAEQLAVRGWRTAGLFLALDPNRVLQLRVSVPRGVDPEAAVQGLALLASEQIVSGVPNVDTEPPSTDSGSTTGTEPLGGSIPFPAEVLGEAVEVTQEATGPRWLESLSPPAQLRRRLVRALEAQGKSLRDLQLEVAQPGSGAVLILAFRVAGADIGPLMKPIFDIMPVTRNDDEVDAAVTGGKRIIPVDDGGNTLYAYPQGDVLWLVLADTDDDLAAVLQQLP